MGRCPLRPAVDPTHENERHARLPPYAGMTRTGSCGRRPVSRPLSPLVRTPAVGEERYQAPQKRAEPAPLPSYCVLRSSGTTYEMVPGVRGVGARHAPGRPSAPRDKPTGQPRGPPHPRNPRAQRRISIRPHRGRGRSTHGSATAPPGQVVGTMWARIVRQTPCSVTPKMPRHRADLHVGAVCGIVLGCFCISAGGSSAG